MGILNDRAMEQAQSEKDQTEEEKKLAGFVRSKVEEIRASANRIAHEGIWMTNIAYLLGYDGISYNSQSRSFQPINRATNFIKRNRVHANKILPTIQNRLARLCKSPPKFDVLPESNDTEDKEAARLSLQVLQTLWERLSVDEKRIFLYMWVQQCGHAWVKVCWDPTMGKMMVNPETGEAGREGDVRMDIVSPFEVFPDPLAKMEEEMQNLTHAKVRKLDYFKTHYPEKGHLVKEEGAWLLSAQYEQRINSLNSRGPSQGGSAEQMKNCAIELVRYEKSSDQYPEGRMIVIANGVVLEDKELPCGDIPFAKFDDVIVGGKFYSESIITHLRPLQDQYNETIRRRGEWTKKLLAGKYKAARGSGLSQESLTDDTEVVYYDNVPSAPNGPEAMQIPNIPQYAYTEEDRLTAMINDISGISEVSRGTLPSASIPAIGMQLLTEQDDTRIGIMTEQHEHAWAKVGKFMLKYVEKYYVMPRKLKIAGKNLQYTVKEVIGKDLKGNTDVMVIKGSTLPGSKTLKRQEVMNAFQQGLLGDPKDQKVIENVLGMLEFGDVAQIWQDYGLDMNQIRQGIAKLEQGQPIELTEFDNHTLWLQELNRYRKGDKFQSLDPQIQQLFMQTMEMAIQSLMPPPPPPPPSPNPAGAMPQPMPGAA